MAELLLAIEASVRQRKRETAQMKGGAAGGDGASGGGTPHAARHRARR